MSWAMSYYRDHPQLGAVLPQGAKTPHIRVRLTRQYICFCNDVFGHQKIDRESLNLVCGIVRHIERKRKCDSKILIFYLSIIIQNIQEKQKYIRFCKIFIGNKVYSAS